MATNYRAATRRAAQRYGLDPNVFMRQIQQESGFRPGAVSPAGAIGIAQIMPATARSWGVDPRNPLAALDAAAKNMARYVKQFGSYRDALIAYNAGPGAVGHSLPAETQGYIATILGGRTPSARGVRPGGGGGGGTTITSTTPKHLAFDPATGGQAAQITLPQRPQRQITAPPQLAFAAHPVSSVPTSTEPQTPQTAQTAQTDQTPRFDAGQALEALTTLQRAQGGTATTGGSKVTTRVPGGGYTPSGRKGSGIFELIHRDPSGPGYGIKNGQIVNGAQVFSSVWGGHGNHVHVAAGPNTVVALGKLAQSMGLHVGENPHFGGVDPVHVAGSYHYKGEAIDVSGPNRLMDRFSKAVERYNRTHQLPRV
jgi:hypothetical protein